MPCIAPLYTAGGSSGSDWEISTATFTQSFSYVSQSPNSTGIAFNDDGTKMYITEVTGYVYQYTLSSAWDISSASYASKVANVRAQSSALAETQFKSDGTKMYVIGGTSVYQYTLSTPWDVSSYSYDTKSFNFTTQDLYPNGLFFSSDGTKMYINGVGNLTNYQYSLGTAWDVSTVSYASISHSTAPYYSTGIYIGKSGTRMYCCQRSGDPSYPDKKVVQYDLGTAWDISSAGSIVNTVDISSKETLVNGLFFKPSGAVFYICGPQSDSVHQYDL